MLDLSVNQWSGSAFSSTTAMVTRMIHHRLLVFRVGLAGYDPVHTIDRPSPKEFRWIPSLSLSPRKARPVERGAQACAGLHLSVVVRGCSSGGSEHPHDRQFPLQTDQNHSRADYRTRGQETKETNPRRIPPTTQRPTSYRTSRRSRCELATLLGVAIGRGAVPKNRLRTAEIEPITAKILPRNSSEEDFRLSVAPASGRRGVLQLRPA
jgi:hypothetical protein